MKTLALTIALLVAACSGTAVKTADNAQNRATAQDEKAALTTDAKKEETKAAEKKEDSGNKITCKSGNDERVLENEVSASKCELRYTKFGQTSTAATGTSDLAHCGRVMDKMKKNLESAGFKCE